MESKISIRITEQHSLEATAHYILTYNTSGELRQNRVIKFLKEIKFETLNKEEVSKIIREQKLRLVTEFRKENE